MFHCASGKIVALDFVQREQASEKGPWRFLENRPRPMGVVHNVTKKYCRAFFDFGRSFGNKGFTSILFCASLRALRLCIKFFFHKKTR
jgi:hypothetical protein